MKIKISKTFQKALAIVLCVMMVFGAAPLAAFLGLIPGISANELYTVRFFGANEEEPYTEVNFAEGEAIVPPETSKEGYSFIKWQPEIPDEMPAYDLEFTAYWEINEYTITFETDGGTEIIAPITQDYATAVKAPADPTKTGYTFIGWENAATEKLEEIPVVMPAEDMLFTAKWSINQYTITFETDGGTEIAPITQDYATAVKAPADPTKDGYSFAGWEPALDENMPAKNVTLTAKWTINSYKITFLNTYDSETSPISGNYESTIVKPENPVRTGYTFAGWDQEIPEKMPANDMIISANWTPNKYAISYDPMGGVIIGFDGIPTQNIIIPDAEHMETYDQAFQYTPAAPTREGYTFTGWEDADGNPIQKVPAADTTYYATWTQGTGGNFYSVEYHHMDTSGKYIISPEVTLYAASAGEIIDITENEKASLGIGFEIDEAASVLSGTVPEEGTLELVVYVARSQYKIEFNSNGGSAVDSIDPIYYGASVTVPQNPTRDGYTFNGWKNNSTGIVENIPGVMPASDLKFTAQWAANTNTAYKIVINYSDATKNGEAAKKTFDFKGTTGSKVKILIDGAAANDGTNYHYLADFTLKHYTLDTTAMAKQQFEGTIAANGSTVLNLYYAPVEYTVTFTVSGNVVDSKKVTYYSHASTVEPDADKMSEVFAEKMPGYTFKSWEPKLSNVVEDISYAATYTANIYKVTFDYAKAIVTDGKIEVSNPDFTPETSVEVIEQEFNTNFVMPAYPAKAGYKCLGWFDASGNEYKPNKTYTMPVDGLDLIAYYEAQPYTITFDTSLEGAELEKTSVKELCDNEVLITADMIPSKEGYTFLGWYDSTDEGSTVYKLGSKITVPAEDITLVAKWATGKFMIVFKTKTNEGEWEILNDITYKDIESDAPITAPDYTFSKDQIAGRTFLGWREEGKKAGDPLFVFDKMPGRSIILEAVWGYTLTFDANSGVLSSEETIVREIGIPTSLAALKVNEGGDNQPTKTGYSFTGWYEIKDENSALANKVADDDIFYYENSTLYAGWTIKEYTMTFDAKGGTFAEEFGGSDEYVITQNYSTAITAPTEPSRIGYTFAEWDAEIPKTMPASETTINAVWSINQYTFKFLDYTDYTENGKETNIIAPITLDYNSEVTVPEDPTRTGYTWKYWVDENGETVEILDTMPAFDVTYYGVFEINQYSITFNTDGGTSIASIEGDYGTAIKKIADPVKTGYTFAGWKNQDGNIVTIPDAIPAENLELTAQWTINKYTVTFKDSDGTVIKSTVQDYGTEIIIPKVPEKIGSKFDGWDIGIVPATVPAHNLTITAEWETIIYTITFRDTDGDVIDTVSGAYGSKVKEIDPPSKWFYNFAGWDKDIPETMPAENMVITATWVRDTSFLDSISSFFMSIFESLTQIINSIGDLIS